MLLYGKQEQFLTTIVFLPSAIQLRNGLTLETKCIESFHSFKNVHKKPAVEKINTLRYLIMAVAGKI